jgi:hypothetical protein
MSKLEKAFAKLDTLEKVNEFVKDAKFPHGNTAAATVTTSFGNDKIGYYEDVEITSKTKAMELVNKYSHTAPIEAYAIELLSEREIINSINKITAPVAAPSKSRVTTSAAAKSSSKRSGGSEATSRRSKA